MVSHCWLWGVEVRHSRRFDSLRLSSIRGGAEGEKPPKAMRIFWASVCGHTTFSSCATSSGAGCGPCRPSCCHHDRCPCGVGLSAAGVSAAGRLLMPAGTGHCAPHCSWGMSDLCSASSRLTAPLSRCPSSQGLSVVPRSRQRRTLAWTGWSCPHWPVFLPALAASIQHRAGTHGCPRMPSLLLSVRRAVRSASTRLHWRLRARVLRAQHAGLPSASSWRRWLQLPLFHAILSWSACNPGASPCCAAAGGSAFSAQPSARSARSQSAPWPAFWLATPLSHPWIPMVSHAGLSICRTS